MRSQEGELGNASIVFSHELSFEILIMMMDIFGIG
jgi:hypothetical protein